MACLSLASHRRPNKLSALIARLIDNSVWPRCQAAKLHPARVETNLDSTRVETICIVQRSEPIWQPNNCSYFCFCRLIRLGLLFSRHPVLSSTSCCCLHCSWLGVCTINVNSSHMISIDRKPTTHSE